MQALRDACILRSLCALCRFAISQHPEVEAKIVEELQAHGLAPSPSQPEPRQLTYADLGKLTYLQAVIKVSPLFLLCWQSLAHQSLP